MDSPVDYLTAALFASVLFFLAISAGLVFWGIKLKKKHKSISDELAKSPVDDLMSVLAKNKAEVEEKVVNGRLTLGKLISACQKAEKRVEMIKAGLPPPTFRIDDDESLKSSIREIRDKQYQLIVQSKATHSFSEWSWFGSKSDGQSLIRVYNKLMISAFNAEVDMARSKMRHSTYDTAVSKLEKSLASLEKLAETVNVTISEDYLRAKEEELAIWHEDLVSRQLEKEERKREKELLRQQNRELARSSDDDEEEDLANELDACEKDLAKARALALEIAGDDLAEIELKIASIEEQKRLLEEKFQRSISQAQITRAGYIYVISNIGSFGEEICKIGMTRRLEPMDRVVELGDASVPYRFDVHTLAFVKDAPAVEKNLHNSFTEKRVNTENHRKEFFYVTPKEVKEKMDNLGIESSWFYDREAKEYRESELRREAMRNTRRESKATPEELPESI